jgi:hypothetical protein
MNQTEKMARNVARSLRIAICEYEHRNGEAPKKIFAELDAYYALQMGAPVKFEGRLFPDQEFTLAGIPLQSITRRGLGIYLCGDPVAILDLPDGDVQVIFRDCEPRNI